MFFNNIGNVASNAVNSIKKPSWISDTLTTVGNYASAYGNKMHLIGGSTGARVKSSLIPQASKTNYLLYGIIGGAVLLIIIIIKR